jgi:eukaryotic-like serine/threonine-protein kinase
VAAPLIQLTPGMVVGGDFRVVKLLSAGGMGAVYVAEQLSTGKRRAIKVMHPQLVADPKLRERFEQEARVGALIASDHVVEVIAAGVESATGMPWIAMELLEGEDLATYVSRHGIPSTEQLKEMVQQLCHALGAAHAAGVVHRDLKPENVFLAKARTAAGRPSIKVLDFGIAKVAAHARTTATAAIGTPAWMSPEQTDPRAPITPSTDVWALGLIVYWLMTGRPYWVSACDPIVSMHAVLREILFEPMEPASVRAGQRGAADRLPPGFDAWFERCVARDAKTRFATATELLESFEQMCSGFESEAVGPPASIPGSIESDSTVPQSSESDLADAGVRVAPTGSTFVAPSTGDEGRAREGSTGPQPRSARRTMAVGVGIGLLAAVAAMVTVRGMGPSRTQLQATTEPSTPTGAPTADPITVAPRNVEAEPIASSSARAIPSTSAAPSPPVTTASARAAPSSKASARSTSEPLDAAGRSASEAPKPFDMAAAVAAVRVQTRNAGRLCSSRPGPKAITATLLFNPDSGAVKLVVMDPVSRATETGNCVNSHLMSVKMDPFSGEGQPVPASVLVP